MKVKELVAEIRPLAEQIHQVEDQGQGLKFPLMAETQATMLVTRHHFTQWARTKSVIHPANLAIQGARVVGLPIRITGKLLDNGLF